MIVVDSSVWVANLRDEDRPAVNHLRAIIHASTTIVVGDIVLLEVLRGARDEHHAAALEARFRRFRIEAMLDEGAAVTAARHYRALRREGITVSKIPDLLIATYCIDRGYALLHDDRHFEAFRRLGLTFAI